MKRKAEPCTSEHAGSKRVSAAEPSCTVGIDFGTSGTGYAFAFRTNKCELFRVLAYFATDAARLSAEIHVKEPGGQEAKKTNTALLLDRNKTFRSFGSKALKDYYDDNKDGTDMLFDKFKMNLHDSDAEEPIATALNGIKDKCTRSCLNFLNLPSQEKKCQ